MSVSCKKVFWAVNIIIPLIVGFMIYFIFRPNAYIIQPIYTLFGIKARSVDGNNMFWKFVNNYACDILWSYSLTFVSIFLLRNMKRCIWIGVLVCVLFETMVESLQLIPAFPGTFDVFDMLAELITTLLAALIIHIFIYKYGGTQYEKE